MLHFRLRALITTSLLLLPAALRADTLLDIYELAVKNDPVIKAAEATYRAGREFEVQGRSQLLPQVGAQAEYGETDVTQESTRTIPIGDQTFTSSSDYDVEEDQENYYLTLSQKLFDVPAWFSFKQGKELSKQAEVQFAADQQELIVRTVEAYVLVLRAIDNLKSSRAAEAAFQRQLEQTQQRFDVGPDRDHRRARGARRQRPRGGRPPHRRGQPRRGLRGAGRADRPGAREPVAAERGVPGRRPAARHRRELGGARDGRQPGPQGGQLRRRGRDAVLAGEPCAAPAEAQRPAHPDGHVQRRRQRWTTIVPEPGR